MALFCDFENVAIGVRESDYAAFDVHKVLERLLLKGDIVVKKAYCDWIRYKDFKGPMHEAAFELIDIPHVRMSGKNSADIRMVVDALDLCYTKPHVDCFVIISGDSDFSPLVSKLRENNRTVIGMGVKNSTSELLTSNCDEFIYYDDLIRRTQKRSRAKPAKADRTPKTAAVDPAEEKRLEGLGKVVATAEDLLNERGDDAPIWGSMVKQTLKRREPGFDETYHGYRSFGDLLEDAAKRGLLSLERDEKSGGHRIKAIG
ncbi:MAG: NYN domain-containing protein [Pseudomonadota bacterium]